MAQIRDFHMYMWSIPLATCSYNWSSPPLPLHNDEQSVGIAIHSVRHVTQLTVPIILLTCQCLAKAWNFCPVQQLPLQLLPTLMRFQLGQSLPWKLNVPDLTNTLCGKHAYLLILLFVGKNKKIIRAYEKSDIKFSCLNAVPAVMTAGIPEINIMLHQTWTIYIHLSDHVLINTDQLFNQHLSVF